LPVDPSRLDTLLAAVEKSYKGSLKRGTDYSQVRRRVSTGSLELDYATGGGFPLGSVIRLWGGPSSGKSLIAWNVIRHAQEMGLGCVYYNIEKQYDPTYTKLLGVDIDKLIVKESQIIEEVGTTLETLLGGAHVHVLDSCTSAISMDELKASLSDWRPGIKARAWGKTLSRVMTQFDQEDNLVILIDQSRESFGYGGEQAPGGRFMEHLSHLTIQVRRGKHLYMKGGVLLEEGEGEDSLSGLKEADGFVSKSVVRKTKVGRPGRTAEMMYDYATCSFDQGYEYAKSSVFFGVVKKSGSWFTLPDDTKVQGETALRIAMLSNPKFMDMTREAMEAAL